MSIKLMVQVWECALPRNEKAVAVKLADFANDDGTGIYPSVGRVAWETGYKERAVQMIIKKLVDRGVLSYVGPHPTYGTNEYAMYAKALPERPSWSDHCASKAEPSEPDTETAVNTGVQKMQGGAKNAGGGVQKTT